MWELVSFIAGMLALVLIAILAQSLSVHLPKYLEGKLEQKPDNEPTINIIELKKRIAALENKMADCLKL